MSILIKGMKMPRSCHECVAGYGMSCFVCPPEEDGECPDQGRASWCPLISIPPHGRLIDADALKFDEALNACSIRVEGINLLIDQMPTIIEAEGDE